MLKILISLACVFSFSFGSTDNRLFNYFRDKFIHMHPYDVGSFLCSYTRTESPYNRFLTQGYTYNYSCNNDVYSLSIGPYPGYKGIDITNHKALIKFVNIMKHDLKIFLCEDPAFRASLFSVIKIEFKIYDSRGNLQETMIFNKNVTPACGLMN